jgi:peroxiredoxin family protein
MKKFVLVSILSLLALSAFAQSGADQKPSDPKAQKTFEKAMEAVEHHQDADALDLFKKADKQDGGHCTACQMQIVSSRAINSRLQSWN